MIEAEELVDETIEATLVADSKRLDAIGKAFRNLGHIVESTSYGFCDSMIEGYRGGYWDYYQTGNDGFFAEQKSEELIRVSSANGHSFELSARAAGVVIWMFASSHVACSLASRGGVCVASLGLVSNNYHALREYSFGLEEAGLIHQLCD